MCGISLLLYPILLPRRSPRIPHPLTDLLQSPDESNSDPISSTRSPSLSAALLDALRLRGPDWFGRVREPVSTGFVELAASVLRIRGVGDSDDSLSWQQPIREELVCEDSCTCTTTTRLLAFNGEIFNTELGASSVDTQFVWEGLRQPPPRPQSESWFASRLSFLRRLRGPFVIVYCEIETTTATSGSETTTPATTTSTIARVLVAKDRIGRRSLVARKCDCGLLLSSVCGAEEEEVGDTRVSERHSGNFAGWVEVPGNSGVLGFEWNSEEGGWESQVLDWGVAGILEGRTGSIPEAEAETEDGDDVVQTLIDVMEEAVRVRVRMWSGTGKGISVLFSGAIDSFFVAVLAIRCLDQGACLELLNVNFGDRIGADRKQAITSYDVLRQSFPERRIRLVLIDVSVETLLGFSDRIVSTMLPCETVLDFNLAASLFFAARGEGRVYRGDDEEELGEEESIYVSDSRVLLSGLGADELLGGYARHRTRLLKGTPRHLPQPANSSGPPFWDVLSKEIAMDVGRLWRRNLGRDDRIVASLGKEARWPFLDEVVISFARGMPHPSLAGRRLPELSEICDMRLGRGVGDKMILRKAVKRLGFPQIASLPKRAMQFGSNISKVSFRKCRGSDVVRDLLQQEIE